MLKVITISLWEYGVIVILGLKGKVKKIEKYFAYVQDSKNRRENENYLH